MPTHTFMDLALDEAHAAADTTLFVTVDKKLYRHEGETPTESRWARAKLPGGPRVRLERGVYATARDAVYVPASVLPYEAFVLTSAPRDRASSMSFRESRTRPQLRRPLAL